MRKRIYELVEPAHKGHIIARCYNYFMFLMILLSVFPLMFRGQSWWFLYAELISLAAFIIDYLLRWSVADYILKIKGRKAFLRYPFTPLAIIDFLTILPGFFIANVTTQTIQFARMIRIIRVLRLVRYSNSLTILFHVFERQKKILGMVLIVAIAYIFTSALVMFNAETEFHSFFEALYWSTVTLTTVGYGDVTPVTTLGRFVSMVSALFGIAIIALPSGIITAGFLDELHAEKRLKKQSKKSSDKEQGNEDSTSE